MKKIYSAVSYGKTLLFLAFMALLSVKASAQIDITIGTGTTGNGNTEYPCPMQDYWEGARAQYLYRASELTALGMGPGNINSIKFNVISLATSGNTDFQIQNLTIKIGTTSTASLSAASWEPGTTTVYGPVNYLAVVGINTFTLTSPFFWNGTDNLIVEVCNGDPANNTGTFWTGNPVVPWTTGLSFNGSHTYRADDEGNLCGTASVTNDGTQTTRPNIIFNWTAASACAGTPTAGTAGTSQSAVCIGESFTLSATGVTVASGLTYQWQSSPDNITWTNIPGGTSFAFTTSQTLSTYYRLVVTCTNGGASASSTAVQVISPLAVSGTFTINSALPTGGTNFANFNDAYNYIKCGINGPVVFNVDAASGPYTEQLIMTPVPGASAANTVTFNGNGRILQFTSTNTNERAVIKLNGADHIIFDSLTINATGTTTSQYGFGVQLLNNADSNIVRKSTINITNASTSTNYTGISISASAASATTTGNSECDGNEFSQNTIKGGYYGITNVGSATVANQANKFVKNTVRDFYTYGFYVNGTFNTLIDGNDISRPTRADNGATSSYAVYFTGLSTNARVNGNFIHGLLDMDITSTNDVYGIYFTGVDALAGLDNKVTNNVIYDMKSNGTVYGIYNSSSDNIFYYHNTISFDHTASTSTEVTRGFYQITTAAGIDFKNNLITISRGGTGQQHGIYTATTATTLTSNYNDFYITPAANRFVGFRTTNQVTLANWQAAATQDANSVSVNPLYTSLLLGNLKPTAAALNDLGTPVASVTVDVLNAPRSATTPDIGAYEFAVPPCTTPPVAGDAISSINVPICPGELVTLDIINNSLGTGQTFQWQSSPDNITWTDISPAQISAGFNINPTTTLYYRCAVTCTGNTTYSTAVQVVVNALFPGGTYTINSAVATGGTNFASFNAAYYALRCGIAGPVVFNVVSGSGPYNEQLIMGQVQGASATNTVTFNGNGETITFLSTNTDQRAVIKLNGTDHFIFDSLRVAPQGSTTSEYGYGFHLLNNADSNIIRKCIIDLSTTTTSTNFAGIVSSVGTGATTTGTNESDYNVFDKNTVTGGYYGITSVGSTASAVGNNTISNNKVKDFYSYGIYLSGNFNTTVEANDISRPVRAATTTFYGVYMTSLNTSVKISKNKIHNPFDADLLSTSSFYGIYVTAVDALAGLENKVTNNIVYNVNGTGTQYGMYNSSSDNIFYYHNTVNLDNTPVTTTNSTYGFYQITTATGIELKDNLITISRGGPGDKYCYYFSTAATTYTSDYNAFFRNAQNAYTGYNGANRLTLADWQTATGKDANSLSTNPYYTNASTGNLEPRSPVLDNKGTPVGITTDIEGETRSATTPDIGAFEFIVPNCTTPPVAGAATAVPNTNICLGTPIQLDLASNSIGAGQTYQWQFATVAAGPYTNLGAPLLFPDTLILASGTYYYRCVVSCSGQSATSSEVLVNMNPPFPAGVYTINKLLPTDYPGGTNFNSFAEAVAVMECGISGAVTFNVVGNTYTEQIRMHRITGASNTSRVTFQSANGNPASVTLTYDATVAGSNYVLQLDSASYITYRGITITAINTTNGRAVDISNTASYDSLVNCVINVPASTSTSNAIAGIFSSSVRGTNNLIKGNTITGGSSGIYFSGFSAAIPTINNIIDSNFINNSYYYGIYSGNNYFTSVSKNTVNVTAPRNATAYGIYLTNNDSAYKVNDNKVNIDNTTTTNYGIYLTGCGTTNTLRGSVSGNKVLAITGNTGSLYGIYQTTVENNNSFNNVINVKTTATTAYGLYSTGGNGGIKYYNNSVQNTSTATGTTNIAAYFSHSTSGQGAVDIRNNIFSHTGGGIAMYQGNVSNIYSDFNMLYTSGATLVRQGTTNYANLQAWKNGVDWDYNSIVYTPAFVAANNELQPDVANPGVWAMHGRGVQIAGNAADINGSPRPTTLTTGVPDMGAYEFLPTVDPPVLPATPAAPAAGITQVFMFGTDTVQKISWAPASTVPATVSVKRYSGIIPPGLAAGQKSMYFYTDVDITGSAPTSFNMQQFYIDPWMRDIPSEPTVKLGRTDAANAWFVASNSVVDGISNVITESNLNFLDKFTGMTDGIAPPPPGDVLTIDTSNKGTRFWVAYAHSWDFYSGSNSQNMVLYLSTDAQPANVTVKVHGTNWTRTYSIPANTVITSEIMPKGGLSDARLLIEGMTPRGISIESSVPITAYAHIYASTNSGATMLLPVGTYGYEYYTLNSRQDYTTTNSHSSFFVIPSRDSTLVEITPSNPTSGGRAAGVPFTVMLNKGEVYQVLGAYLPGGGTEGYDMTGSRVKSIPNASGKCYPIAVFAGSTRTGLGCGASAGGSGDVIFQQVFPSQAWGQRYLTAPTSTSGAANSFMTNIYRVMVKDPATVVTRNGVTMTGLINNRYYQFEDNVPNDIQADKPVMVAQYMSSSGACPNTSGSGDPEMFYLSPVEQSIRATGFYRNNLSAITVNYLTLIVPTAGVASMTIDGSSTFTHTYPHTTPGYTVVVQRWAAGSGQSRVQCDSAFTGIVYGLGSVESYGYNAGTLVKNLSAVPSINNVLGSSATSSYTCKGTPFRFNLLISVKPTQLIWNFSQVSNLTPNANVTQVNPVPIDSTIINGKKFYKYTVNQDYVFSATGNYVVPITLFHPSIEGCGGSMDISLPITVIAAPVSDFTTTFSGCVGDVVQFNGTTVTSNSVPVNQWSWNFGDGSAASTLQNPTHTYATAGTYNVSLRGIADDGCIGDTTKPLVVNPRPTVTVVKDTVYVCNGASATFSVQNPVAGATYNWYDAATAGNLLGTGTSYTVNNVTGFVNVYVEAVVLGCNSVNRTRATAGVLPTLATPVAIVDSIGVSVLVFRWAAVPNATGYQVTINGGATWITPSSGPTGLTHTVSGLALGTTVTLQVRAVGGCLPSESQPVSATTRTDQIYIPNAFTPNGDGLNDVLRVYSNVIRQMRFAVFNQWGEKIFESTSQTVAWDGTHKGKPQPSGVYMYVCDITLNTGVRIQRKGSINLVR